MRILELVHLVFHFQYVGERQGPKPDTLESDGLGKSTSGYSSSLDIRRGTESSPFYGAFVVEGRAMMSP